LTAKVPKKREREIQETVPEILFFAGLHTAFSLILDRKIQKDGNKTKAIKVK
jgi:hypothetical protein